MSRPTPSRHKAASGAGLRTYWQSLAPREQALVTGAVLVVVAAVLWWVALAPALAVLRNAPQQHRSLDAQLLRMQTLQAQAQALQSQPRLSTDDALRLLESTIRQHLGVTARYAIAGERVTITLSGASADAVARWLTQARVNARAVPGEARLTRNPAGGWDGTLVLMLPTAG